MREMQFILKRTLFVGLLLLGLNNAVGQNYEIDPTFTVGAGLNDVAEHLIIQPDGKILVAGDFTDYNGTTRNKIVRLLADGTVDNTFDAGTTFSSASITDMALQSSGKIIVSGTFGASLLRLNADGTTDGTFTFDDTPYTTYINALDVDSNDKIIVGEGSFGTGSRIARLNADGTADATFAADIFTGSSSGNRTIEDITIQDDGKVLVGGDFTSFKGNTVKNFIRLNSDGSVDNTFTPNYTMDVLSSDKYALRQQDDGKVLVGTMWSTGGRMARFNTDGSADNSFDDYITYQGSAVRTKDIITTGTDPVLMSGEYGIVQKEFVDGTTINITVGNGFETSSGIMTVDDIEVDANGRIVAVGNFETYGGTTVGNHIIRLDQCSTVDITSEPENPYACENTDTGFGVDATGTGLTYQWQVNTNNGTGTYTDLSDNATYSGTSTDSLTISNVTLGTYDNHRFRCIVSDGSCFVTSYAAGLTVRENQEVTVDPISDEVCEGDDITFTTTVSGPFGDYQWQENTGSGFTDISGETATSLTISNATQAMAGNEYRLIASYCLADTSDTATILNVIEPPVLTVEDYEFCGGLPDPMTLDIQVTGPNSPYNYQWKGYEGVSSYSNINDGVVPADDYYIGGTYSGTTTQSMSVSSPVDNLLGSPAVYKVDVTDGVCSVESDFINVVYYPTPTITDNPQDVTICEDDASTVQFSFNIGNANGTGMGWQVDSTGTGTNFEDLSDNAVYSGTNTFTLSIDGSAIDASADGYLYRGVAGDCSPEVVTFEATLYVDEEVTLLDYHENSELCEGMEAYFDVDAPQGSNYSFEWQERVSGGSWTTLTNGGNYAGVDTDSLIILSAALGMDLNQYRCIITNGTCELITNQRALYVNEVPTISQQPQNVEICEGENATFSVNTPFGTNPTYQWQVDETGNGNFVDVVNSSVYNGANNDDLSLVAPDASYDGYQFRCVVSECLPEVYSDTVTLTVNTIPSLMSQPMDQMICEDSTAIYEVEGDATGYDYQWQIRTPGGSWGDLSDGSTVDGSLTDSLSIDGTYSQDDYEVRCVISNGLETCAAISDTVTYGVYPGVEPFLVNVQTYNDPTVIFETNADSQMDLSQFDWYWDFGDGDTTQNDLNPEHTYSQNGQYDACLIIVGECDSVAQCVTGIAINTVGVDSYQTDEFEVYPNPTDGIVFISWSSSEIERISLTNVVGQQLNEFEVRGKNSLELQIEGKKGIYFVHLTDRSGNTTTKKVIKN